MRYLALIGAPVLLALAVLAGRAETARPGDDTEAARLLFLLQYVGADYGDAVAEGKILDPFEYREVSGFSATLVERFDVLRGHGASPDVGEGLARLQELIRKLRPWDEVRALVTELTSRLFDELQIVSLPAVRPDPARGASLYAGSCAPCHGPAGGGDGFGDPAMEPPPTSFRAARMNLLSPHQVFGATYFGVDGTAMPSYRDALPAQELWDIVFHVLTLREDFRASEAPAPEGVSLEEVVRHSSDELRVRLSTEGFSAEAADVDRLRLDPPEARPPKPDGASAVVVPTARATADAGGPLDVALALQEAFAGVAEAVLPSVVNVTSFVRDDAAAAPAAAAPKAQAWRLAGDPVETTYPGFRRWRSGSGFFVTADGYVLTCHHVVTRDDGTPAEAIDVELPGGRRVLSRLVGAEPTIDLAVLKLEVVAEARPLEVRPATLGDSDALQVGHWIIAVGDPWGPERTYAVGTLAARPDRECYQDQLSGTLLQASLDVHPEAYGGPLVDIHGRVIGLTVPPPGGGGLGPRGAEFGLPINLALNIYEALKVAESRRSPWLGVSVLELAAVHRRFRGAEAPPALPRTGVFLDGVFEPGPASRAGIRAGDSLVAIDGNRLFSVLDFQKWLYLSGIGRTVTLDIFRDGKTTPKKVTIEERPAGAATR